MTHKLTVLIPCKDERRNIRDCIESVRPIADEILVADSGSTDGTLDIVRHMPDVRVIQREYIDDASFKQWSIPQATHNWVLAIDADERVSPELASDILRVLGDQPKHDAYSMPQRNYFLGHPIRFSGWSTRKTRLFRRDVCYPRETRIHPCIHVPTGNIGKLRGRLIHYSLWTIDDFFARLRVTANGPRKTSMIGGDGPVSSDLTLRPATRFVRHYLWQLGFLDGVPGLLVAWMASYTVFLKYARLWAMRNQLPQPERDAEFATQVADRETTLQQAA